ncbi:MULTISPECIES: LysR family transcriptional regulator [Bacillus cereus group]|uniref:HTH-type transcriptional regulator CzcR n=2 Tax=Bacillus cereus group TaxID=86661 RepID=A0A2C1DXY6_BACCE|nr:MULTISPECIES: LysR family transcriptional regulator [Bacillus cereus group]OFD81341.1 LysR family transcriptional regulator [Bacillus mycoides]OFD81584.1 LysR family transcriptional regulator [Bacillus mycoides]OFD83875.1 LysR family transcriptional regulator [Bacillus mycoides]PGT05232.1 LysR family transcriptional regulator [Bacillus cereus]
MNVFDFKVFKNVARLNSISLAAKELHMTQPAITHIINKLEKRYALTLFDRSRQGTMLTENGKEFLVCVDRLLMEYENLEETALQLKNKSLYKIVLATYPSVTVYCLAECIQLGNINQSQYVLAVREGSYQEVLDWLSAGSADFSISIKENLIPGFHYEVIGEDPYVIVSSKTIPPNLTSKELKNYPFIMPLSGCKEVLEPYLMKNEITVNKVMESESISSALALTLQVNGITIVPLSGLHKQIIHDFIVQPIEIKISRQLIMQWSPKKEKDPLFLAFVTNLLAQLQQKKNE